MTIEPETIEFVQNVTCSTWRMNFTLSLSAPTTQTFVTCIYGHILLLGQMFINLHSYITALFIEILEISC